MNGVAAAATVIALIFEVSIASAAPPQSGKPSKAKPIPLAQTGQVTSYASGDDGDLQIGTPSPDPRFINNGDGTVTDKLTSLIWTQDAGLGQSQTNWLAALNVCNSLSLGTASDWRLPNIRELLSLLDFEAGDVTFDGTVITDWSAMFPANHPFINIQPPFNGAYYWTSTTNSVFDTHHDAYGIDIVTGEIRIVTKGAAGNFLCVRGAS